MINEKYADYAWEQTAALLAIDSPSGFTRRAAEWVKTAFEALGFPAKITTKGGVLADLGGENVDDGLFLEAHSDTLGAMVAQIKGSGIGTSATRAEILKKLFNIKYMALNEKTQVITPTYLGELIYEVVHTSMKQLLNPELTASWEKGLTYVAEGSITPDEYMQKLERFVIGRTYNAVHMGNTYGLRPAFDAVAVFYQNAGKEKKLNFKKGNDHEKRRNENHRII